MMISLAKMNLASIYVKISCVLFQKKAATAICSSRVLSSKQFAYLFPYRTPSQILPRRRNFVSRHPAHRVPSINGTPAANAHSRHAIERLLKTTNARRTVSKLANNLNCSSGATYADLLAETSLSSGNTLNHTTNHKRTALPLGNPLQTNPTGRPSAINVTSPQVIVGVSTAT